MMEGELEGSKALPDAIVRDVLGSSESCLAFARQVLDKGASIRDEARTKLNAEGKIHSIAGVEPLVDPGIVEGVDGSYHSIRTAALDLSLCSAIGAGGTIRHN